MYFVVNAMDDKNKMNEDPPFIFFPTASFFGQVD